METSYKYLPLFLFSKKHNSNNCLAYERLVTDFVLHNDDIAFDDVYAARFASDGIDIVVERKKTDECQKSK